MSHALCRSGQGTLWHIPVPLEPRTLCGKGADGRYITTTDETYREMRGQVCYVCWQAAKRDADRFACFPSK